MWVSSCVGEDTVRGRSPPSQKYQDVWRRKQNTLTDVRNLEMWQVNFYNAILDSREQDATKEDVNVFIFALFGRWANKTLG